MLKRLLVQLISTILTKFFVFFIELKFIQRQWHLDQSKVQISTSGPVWHQETKYYFRPFQGGIQTKFIITEVRIYYEDQSGMYTCLENAGNFILKSQLDIDNLKTGKRANILKFCLIRWNLETTMLLIPFYFLLTSLCYWKLTTLVLILLCWDLGYWVKVLLMYVVTHFKRFLPVISQQTDLCEWSLDGFNELTNETLSQIYELGIGYKPGAVIVAISFEVRVSFLISCSSNNPSASVIQRPISDLSWLMTYIVKERAYFVQIFW